MPVLQVSEPKTATRVSRVQPPVFLVGPARSGTSLVYKALCLHPDVAYVSNWVARFPRVPELAVLNRLGRRFDRARHLSWFGEDSNAYVYGRKRGLRERLFPAPVEGEPVYASCGVALLDDSSKGPDLQGERGQRRLRRVFASICRAAGAPILVNKRIGNNRRIAFLAATFPGARFVSIVRDGRAVALSLSKVDWWQESFLPRYGGTPARWAAEGNDPWEACARNWVEDLRAVEEGLAQVPDEQVLRVSYEAFVDSPQTCLADIAAFAGLAPSREWQDSVARLAFPNKNGKWRESLDPSAIAAISAVQRPQLEAHGYDV